MHSDPTVHDSGFDRRAVFLVAAASLSELAVDHLDRQPPGVIDLYRVRQLKQFLLGGLGRSERALLLEFHLGCMIAMATASARRRSPLRPRDMSLPPNNSFGLFDDLYGVPSDVGERNDGCLLYFVPENASRIFYVHINRLIAH
jgi:hypothetical protein